MPSFGEKLRLEREKRKITLEQISSSTKIGTRMLQALEEGKFNQLPGGIFNKGFVRAYARTLGLDEEQTIADYLEASGDAPQVRTEPDDHEPRVNAAREPQNARLEIRAEVASRQLPWGIFAIVLLIIALALSLWSHRRREQERLAHSQKASQRLAAESSGESPSQPNPPGSASPISTSAPLSVSANQPVTQPAKPLAASGTPLSTEKSATNPPVPNGATSTTASNPDEFVVVIQARDESWLSVIVDGKAIGSETLEAGDERTYHGRNRVLVKAGNAGALDFRLNGKTLPIGGDFGEVKTVTIGPSGLILPPVDRPEP